MSVRRRFHPEPTTRRPTPPAQIRVTMAISRVAPACAILLVCLAAFAFAADCRTAPTGCSARGFCDPATALCQCTAPYLGPNCALTGNRVLLSDARGLAMHYAVAGAQLHVRVESTKEANWMGVGIGASPTDGMSNGDMWVVRRDKTTNAWLIEDQFGSAGTGRPTAAEQQDLLNRIVWQPTNTTLAASFSRLLVTNDTMLDVPLVNSGANTLVTWAMGTTPFYGAAHADAENNGADQFEMNFFTACPNACSGHGQCPPGVPAAFANQCRCEGAWVGPACDVPATNANMTLSAALGFVLVWGQSAGDATLHFRLESKQANWISIGTNANLDDGMTLGDFAVVFRDAAFNWVVQDQYGTGQEVPLVDRVQNLMHTNVWNASATAPSLHASWSRLIDSQDAAQDWPFVAGPMYAEWAVGNQPTYGLAHKGADEGGASEPDGLRVNFLPCDAPVAAAADFCGAKVARGACNARTGMCECAAGRFGPDCAVVAADTPATAVNRLAVAPTDAPSNTGRLVLSTSLDAVDRSIVHFRIDSTQANWVGFMLSPTPEAAGGDGMIGGDTIVALFDAAAKEWRLEDQWGIANYSTPKRDVHYDLLTPNVWQPTTKTLAATWSRKLVTRDTTEDRPVLAGAQPMGLSWAVGLTPAYAQHGDPNDGAAGWTQAVLVASACGPLACMSAGGQGVCDAASAQCRCNAGYFGRDCATPAAAGAVPLVLNATIGLTLSTAIDAAVGDLVHFRLESAQGNWMSIMVSPRPEATGGDGMLEGDGVAVFYDAATQTWTAEDQYGVKNFGVPVRDTHQDLTNVVVWQSAAPKKSLIATWSRRLITGDVAQDKPIAVGAGGNAITWAVGPKPTYGDAHLGLDEGGCGYATIVVLGAPVVPTVPDSMTRAITAPMLIALGILGAVIAALAVIQHAPGVGNWRAVRWLLYGRYVPWPKAPAALDWATLGVLPMLRSHTHGQNLVFALYLAANAVLIAMAHARYAAVAATMAPAPSRFPYVLGYLSSLHLALAMLPANRNSFLLRVCGVPFERALHWHKVVRYVVGVESG